MSTAALTDNRRTSARTTDTPVLVRLDGTRTSSTVRALITFFASTMGQHGSSELAIDSVTIRQLVDNSMTLLEEILPQAQAGVHLHERVMADARTSLRRVFDFVQRKVGTDMLSATFPDYVRLASAL